jgi:hypothetical protein
MGWQSFPDLNSAPAEVMFRLPASHGRTVALDDYRQRQGLCLLFLSDGDGQRWLSQLEMLAAAREDFRQRDAAPLAVALIDQQAAAALAAALSRPLVVLADGERARQAGGRGKALRQAQRQLERTVAAHGEPSHEGVLARSGDGAGGARL